MISFLELIGDLLQKTWFIRTRHRFRNSKQIEVKWCKTSTSFKSNSIKWKDDQQDLLPHFPSVWLKIQSVLFSVFFFVVCLVLLVDRQTNIVHSFRVSSSFHVQFLLDITKPIRPQNVDLSAQWIHNWFHDVPFSENEIKYPIHEELYQHTVSSILVCSIQIEDQIILFESYFLLERLDQLFFLRNYVNLYFQREYFLILNETQTQHLSLDVIFCYSDISLSFPHPYADENRTFQDFLYEFW